MICISISFSNHLFRIPSAVYLGCNRFSSAYACNVLGWGAKRKIVGNKTVLCANVRHVSIGHVRIHRKLYEIIKEDKKKCKINANWRYSNFTTYGVDRILSFPFVETKGKNTNEKEEN